MSTPTETPVAVLRDTAVVRHFRTGTPDGFLPAINTDLGLRLDTKTFHRLQKHFRDSALRDPTVGELRLLDALHRSGLYSPARIAAGELSTESQSIALVWADMMAKHGALHGVGNQSSLGKSLTPPCTLTDALALTGRYLLRAGLRADTDTVLLSEPRQEPVAAAAGYIPVARVALDGETRSVWRKQASAGEGSPVHAGDFILYLPDVSLHKIQALLTAEITRSVPIAGNLRAVAEDSLLLTVLDLGQAVDLYASRLIGADEEPQCLPLEKLCAIPKVNPDGACGYLLRVPLKHIQAVNQALTDAGLSAVICGRVRTGGNSVIYLRDPATNQDVAAATLPSELLRSAARIGLYSMSLTSSAEEPSPVYQHRPLMARFPSVFYPENGLTSDGRETVALTLHEGRILRIPECNLLMTAVKAAISQPGSAFKQAADTVSAAALTLADLRIPTDRIRLAVTLTAPSPRFLTDGTALSAICGIYCAAAQLELPIENSVITTAPAEAALQITVTAWAQDADTCAEIAYMGDDRQWRTADQHHPVGKDSVGYLLPVLRRSYEDSLKALSAALNRNQPARCLIHPLAMNVYETDDPHGPRYTLNQDSVRQLCEQLLDWNIPVISMSRADTHLLLSEPAVREALERVMERGYSVLVLGESCGVFAEWGYLPTAVQDLCTLTDHPASATVTYRLPAAEPSTRLLRTKPLVPANRQAALSEPHILTLRFPDGTLIPDGFIGRGGCMLGLLNGPDTTLLPCLQTLRFRLPS